MKSPASSDSMARALTEKSMVAEPSRAGMRARDGGPERDENPCCDDAMFDFSHLSPPFQPLSFPGIEHVPPL